MEEQCRVRQLKVWESGDRLQFIETVTFEHSGEGREE